MSRRLAALAAVLAMTVSSALILQTLVAPGLWLPRTLLCVGVVALVVTLIRTRTQSAGLPSLTGFVAGLLAISAVYFPEEALLRVLPTASTIEAAAEAIPEAFGLMRTSFPPLTSGEGVAFLVTTGVVVVFVLAEMLGVGAFAPAWSGLPMLTLWAIPILLGATVSPVYVVVAGAAYVLLIVIQARDDARYRRRPTRQTVRTTTALMASALIAAFVLAPMLLRLPVPVRVHPFYELVGSSTTRLDLGLGLRDDLIRNNDVELIAYTGATPAEVGPLHAYTVDEFTGSDWVRGDGGEALTSDGQILWPTTLGGLTLGEQVDLEINVANLGQDRLLLPGEPRLLRLPADVQYLPASDEAVAHIGGEVSYDVSFLPRALGTDALSQLQPATDVDPALLAVPETGYESDIAALTRRIVDEAGAESSYEQLLAIQNYLRDPGEFVYSTTIAPPTTPDAVWDFLNDRHGYCVQFATSMIIMARTLGMPARLAVGFLPGEEGSDGVVNVTAHDAHAWPQVQFEGVGWVRFEPTPGVQAGPPPVYAPETSSPEPEETGSTASSAAPSEGTSTATSRESSSAGGGTAEDEQRRRSPWLVSLLVLVGLAGAASALARRHAKLQRTDLHERWDHVLRYLERLGVDVAASRTPRAITDDAVLLLDDEAAAALTGLADAVEAVAYRPGSTPRPPDEQIDTWVETVVESVRQLVRERTSVRVGG